MCCPLVFEFSVGIGGFCHRTGSDLLLFLFRDTGCSNSVVRRSKVPDHILTECWFLAGFSLHKCLLGTVHPCAVTTLQDG